jgi:PBSX family phage terminase large subunit
MTSGGDLCMSTAVLKRYVPRGAAREVFQHREPEVLTCGAAGTGKSRGVLEKVHALCLLNGACPKKCQEKHEHVKGLRALIVRKTMVSLTSTGIVTYKEHVAAEAIEAGIVTFFGGSKDEPAQYRYSNGSKIMLGGMDNPTKIMSGEYDIIFVQEATELTITDWEKLKTRLRNGRITFQQLIADCNPEGPDHWLKRRCDEGKTVMLYSRHQDNPVLFDDDGEPTERGRAYLAVLDNLTGVRKLRLQGGIWAAAEGVIYEDFDPAVHISTRQKLPPEWRRIWGIDFGYVNPFVWQQWAIDPDNGLWLEREIYITQTLVEDIVPMIMREVLNHKDLEAYLKTCEHERREPSWPEATRSCKWTNRRPDWIITDHDAEDRATFERHSGMRTIAAFKEVSPGIQAMQKRMKVQGNGKAGIHFLATAPRYRDARLADQAKPMSSVQEITGYVWKEKPRVSTTGQEKPEPDEPLKLNDHGMDAARYVVAQIDLRQVPRVRRM